ncbi:CLUMA_CG002985, isoform A [Clunio marinus]|uniref:CLUMA_CG002985, isoform A n=1 Tax=Clunio marinus TaxID=568069 RepID=A0A1J1HNW7_9DIPT|nr:CLUMA_CG002985, isoform A [Clunio marinus]
MKSENISQAFNAQTKETDFPKQQTRCAQQIILVFFFPLCHVSCLSSKELLSYKYLNTDWIDSELLSVDS